MAYNNYGKQTGGYTGGWSSVPEYKEQPAGGPGFQSLFDKGNIRSASDSVDQGGRDSDDECNSNDPFSNNISTMDAKLINDRELLVKKLSVDQKKFSIVLRENDFGRFIRIIETTKKFSKNKVIIPEGLLSEFLGILNEFSYQIPEKKIYSEPSYGTFSDIINKRTLKQHSKSIFIELRENKKGRFLKIISLLRQERQHVIVPAAGMSALYSLVEAMMQESDLIVRANIWEDDAEKCVETRAVNEGNHDVLGPAMPAKSESIARIYIDSHVYFDVILAGNKEIDLKITDGATDASPLIAHKNWAACVRALQLLIEKYPPANSDT